MTYNYNRSDYYQKTNRSDDKKYKNRFDSQKNMKQDSLIIDGNTVYEIDEDCIKNVNIKKSQEYNTKKNDYSR